jgi:hypothetical protein
VASRLRKAAPHVAVVYDRDVVDEHLDRDRRFVLRALACLVPTMACVRTTAPVTSPPLVLSSAPVPGAIAVLGRRYLDAYPEDADHEVLRRALGLDQAGSEDAVFERIGSAIRRDLGTGEVVDVDGWQLTRTECRLYAVVALT